MLRDQSWRYREAIQLARQWLDQLEVDPISLRKHGVKGKKKLVEIVDGYYRLAQVSEGSEKERLLAEGRRRSAITYETAYHDMATVSDKEFKEDATSYLRAAVLMDRMGLDTTLYRSEILKIKPRLDAHLEQRGPHQRIAFDWYYRHFGLEPPFPLSGSLARGQIARRPNPERIDAAVAYDITHEIFIPYEYGERLDADPFTLDDKAYLKTALAFLINRFIERENPDLVGELVSCLRYLKLVEEPAYRDGLHYLFKAQNQDGSWGDAVKAKRAFGAFGPQGQILHTTVVVVDALTVAFHWPWNEALFPGCEQPI